LLFVKYPPEKVGRNLIIEIIIQVLFQTLNLSPKNYMKYKVVSL
jgi:hypothetical protein